MSITLEKIPEINVEYDMKNFMQDTFEYILRAKKVRFSEALYKLVEEGELTKNQFYEVMDVFFYCVENDLPLRLKKLKMPEIQIEK